MEHISDTDLERYYLGVIPDGPELAVLEEHLLICSECVDRAEGTQNYVDQIRAGLIRGRFDLHWRPTAVIRAVQPKATFLVARMTFNRDRFLMDLPVPIPPCARVTRAAAPPSNPEP
jgi:hypothetical protein